MKKKSMKYLESLEKVENWLEKTAIRKYCRQVCDYWEKQSQCCICGKLMSMCKRPPLSCSVFICDNLKEYFGVNKEEYKKHFINLVRIIQGRKHHPEEIRNNINTNIPFEIISFITNISRSK